MILLKILDRIVFVLSSISLSERNLKMGTKKSVKVTADKAFKLPDTAL